MKTIETSQGEQILINEMTEKELQKNVIDAYKKLNWEGYHTWMSAHSASGFPDWVFIRERVFFAELKRQDREPTLRQQKWIDALRAAGQEVYVWKPENWFSGEIGRILSEVKS